MSLALPLKKLVLELRYKPELAFYGKMDEVALALAAHFPDWERSPLTVEVRNKSKHRRVFFSSQRCFYEADLASGDTYAEFDFAETTLSEVCAQLSITELRRLGVRQWFACDLGKAFALMTDEISTRFLNRSEKLTAILTDRAEDVAYAVDYQTPEGWKYHLRLGPMTRDEWFRGVHYERSIFGSPDDETCVTFEEYRKGFPESFLFVDIDCYEEDVSTDRFKEFVTTLRRKSHDVVSKLIHYCRE